jgi:hypothetical protein
MKTTILRKQKDGRIYLREAVTVAFFLSTPLHDFVHAVRAAFQLFLQAIPSDVLTWGLIGANSEAWTRISKTTLSRCLSQLEPARTRARPLTYFELGDGTLGGEAPGYGVIVVGSPGGDRELRDEVNLFQMSFPVEVIDSDTVEDFVGFCRRVAEALPYVSGYASPSLQWAMMYMSEAMDEARGIAMRHPGYDVQFNVNARLRLGNRVRGARWLTFLGPGAMEAVGGESRLRSSLSGEISVEQVGSGTMIRAGTMPELGDVNKGIGVPLLREVAAVLEPITAFQELVLLGNFADNDEAFFEAWERRLLT